MLWEIDRENQLVHCPMTTNTFSSTVTRKELEEWEKKIAQKVQDMWKWSQELKQHELKLQAWEAELTRKQSTLSTPYRRHRKTGYERSVQSDSSVSIPAVS